MLVHLIRSGQEPSRRQPVPKNENCKNKTNPTTRRHIEKASILGSVSITVGAVAFIQIIFAVPFNPPVNVANAGVSKTENKTALANYALTRATKNQHRAVDLSWQDRSLTGGPPDHIKTAQAVEGLGTEADNAQPINAPPSWPIPFNVSRPKGANTSVKYLRVSGLPPAYDVSAGFKSDDFWYIPVDAAEQFYIVPNSQYEGSFKLGFAWANAKRQIQTEKEIPVAVKQQQGQTDNALSQLPSVSTRSAEPNNGNNPGAAATTVPTPNLAPSSTATRATPKQSGVSPDFEQTMMSRAAALLNNLDISAARLIYESIAVKGSADAAYALGQTYDPQFLASFPISGLAPDLAKARKWYERAVLLGNDKAEKRLIAMRNTTN